MRVIFLDIDGVLTSMASYERYKGWPRSLNPSCKEKFDPVAISVVSAACAQTGAKIILSSTWRHHHTPKDMGEALGLPIVGATPDFRPHTVSRGREIHTWLEMRPDVKQYAIVDDDDDLLPYQKPHHVSVDYRIGLGWAEHKEILRRLYDQ